jgi:hypothetical protein
MLSALNYRRIICYVDGGAQKPKAPATHAASNVKEKYKNDLETWEIRNKHAWSILLSTLPEAYQIEVIELKTAIDTWETISSKFDNQSEMVQIDLLQQMNQTQCVKDSGPCKTIQTLQALQEKYTSAGGCLESAQFTAILLSAMLDKYRPLLHALIASTHVNNQTLNPNDLISHITEAAKHNFT